MNKTQLAEDISYLHGLILNLQIQKEKVIEQIEKDFPCGWAPPIRIGQRTRLTFKINKLKRRAECLRITLKAYLNE